MGGGSRHSILVLSLDQGQNEQIQKYTEISFVFHSAAAAGLRPYSETGPRPHTSLYPVVSEGTWLEKNNYAQFDGWELRQLINFVAVSLIAI